MYNKNQRIFLMKQFEKTYLRDFLFILTLLVASISYASDSPQIYVGKIQSLTKDQLFSMHLRADTGDAQAQYEIGKQLFVGEIIPKDVFKARHYLKLASEQSHKEALVLLAQLTLNGIGGEKNTERAISLFKEAGERGSSFAYLNLGQLFYDGKVVEQNYTEAKKYFKIAYQMTEIGEGAYGLGVISYLGLDGNKDSCEAITYFENPYLQENSKALFYLGKTFENGECTKQGPNLSYALRYYEQSAKLGQDLAMFKTGMMYYYGTGSKRDFKKAQFWLSKATHNGDLIYTIDVVGVRYSLSVFYCLLMLEFTTDS